MPVRKYQTYYRGEDQLAAAATAQRSMITGTVAEDGTIVGVIIELAIASEPIDSDGSTAVTGAGFLRTLGPTLTQPNLIATDFNPWDTDNADTVMDQDNGDIWAMSPFAVQSSGPGTGRQGSVWHLTLRPGTKRKMRRGDIMEFLVNWSNSGQNQAVLAWCVTCTVFYQT